MHWLHAWSTDGSRLMYWYQDPVDFEQRLVNALPGLRAVP
jgi:hypothetical protein